MNFLGAILLITTNGNEEHSFWILAAIVEDLLRDYFGLSLTGALVDQRVFLFYVERRFPRLFAHLERIFFPMSVVSVRWFMCIFAETDLPSATLLWIWDMVLFRGPVALFEVIFFKYFFFQSIFFFFEYFFFEIYFFGIFFEYFFFLKGCSRADVVVSRDDFVERGQRAGEKLYAPGLQAPLQHPHIFFCSTSNGQLHASGAPFRRSSHQVSS